MPKKRVLLLLALMSLFIMPALADSLEETVLFSGEAATAAALSTAVEIPTLLSGGTFDPASMRRGGYFTVLYDGSERAVTLTFVNAQGDVLAAVNSPATTRRAGMNCIATFTFEQCEMRYGSQDFSQAAAIRVDSSSVMYKDGLSVKQVSWHGYPQDDAGMVLFSGEANANAKDSLMMLLFTSHAGGGWDAAQMNEESAFEITYAGPKDGIYLALSSYSGAKQWVRVDADEITDTGDNRRVARFSYETIVHTWGSNFARLDQLSVFSNTSQPATVHRVVYVPGDGEPVDSSDGQWNRPDTGVAFIGDSICQNAMLVYGDWNGFLGREDCSNYGIGGQTTLECRARIQALCKRNYDQIVFLCGINDIGHGYYDAEIVGNYAAMIEALKTSNPEIRIAIVSVLPTTEAFYYGMQHRIVQLNTALAELAAKTVNVAYVNCYDDFLDAERGYAKPELLSDGLHPNADGYAIIARRLEDVLMPEQK